MRRFTTATGVLFLMLGLIAPAATTVQTPQASPAASPVSANGAWEVTDVRAFEVDGAPRVLSPDGQWMAGRGPDLEFCVWNVKTLAPRCAERGVPVLPDTVAWAPDSSAVAFSQLGAGRLTEPGGSDILVFNVADGVLRNLMDPNEGIATPNAENQTRIDVYPAWSPDSDELAFVRLQGVDDEETAIMRISRDGGEPETVVNTGQVAAGPLFWVTGDRIFYSVSALGSAESDKGIWEVGLDGGSPRRIMPGGEADEVHLPTLVDVVPDGSWFTVYAGSFLGMREGDGLVAVVNSQTGDVQTFSRPDNAVSWPVLASSPSFSPDGQWLVAITMDGFGTEYSLGLWEPGTGGPSTRIPLADNVNPGCCFRNGLLWAENNTVLLTGPGGGKLITLGQTSGASASDAVAASPVAAESNWQVTDIREIEVEGTPIALSPDGRWLAGTGEDSHQVCAWNVETLASTCADVAGPVGSRIGNSALRWAPDSSAFAFVEEGRWRVGSGDVYVFEVATGELTNLTNIGGVTEDGPLYIGADWTSGSQQVVFEVLEPGNSTNPYELVRVDRSGGELESIPLPALPESYDILFMFPPLVGGDAVFVPIGEDSVGESEIGGIWRVSLDGGKPVQVVNASIDEAVPVSVTRDGRFVNVVSMTGFRRLQVEGTFFLLDAESGELMPLESDGSVGLISFAPEGNVGLMVQERNGEDRLATIDPETGVITPVAGSPVVEPWLTTIPVWAENDTVFIPTDVGGILITLETVA